MKLLLYCTKAKPYLYRQDDDTFKLENKIVDEDISDYKKYYGLNNGKIVAECDFDVEEITNCGTSFMIMKYDDLQESYKYTNKIARGSCLDYTDLRRYLGTNNGYAIHIKNLHIFDEPIELNNFLYEDDTDGHYGVWEVERTPVNYTILATDVKDIGGVYCCRGIYGRFLALSSHELCDILNGKKTIVVRKRVSKEMM